MFAFKVSPKGYVYVRLDKLTNMSVFSDVFLLAVVLLQAFLHFLVSFTLIVLLCLPMDGSEDCTHGFREAQCSWLKQNSYP